MKKIIYAATLFSFLGLSSKAQWTTDTLQNTMVRDSAGTSEVTPLSATLSDGSTYISWFESYNGNYQMRMQHLDTAGNKLWNPGGLVVSNAPQSSSLFRYDLKVDHNDNAIVAFQDTRSIGLNVVASMIDPNGNFLWGASGILLYDSLATEGVSPVIGVTASDDMIIAWNASNSSSKWISYQKISLAGALMWSATPKRIIDSTNVKKYSRPSIAVAGSDDFMMLHVQETGSFPYVNTMYAQRYDVNGDAVWSNSIQVSVKTIPFFFFPEAVSDLNDGMYVGFNTSNPVNAALNDVYVQHVDATGGLWSATGTEADVSTTTQKTTPSLKYLASRSEIWVLMKIQDSGQSLAGISVQKFDTTGNPLLTANGVIVMTISSLLNEPYDFESTGDGMIIVFAENSSSTLRLLKAMKIDYTGSYAWALPVIAVSSVASAKLNASEGTFHNGQVVVAWEDQRIDDGIYAQNISSDGIIGPLAIQNEIIPAESFNLFPNPSSDFPLLQFRSSKTGEIVCTITDVAGNMICTKNIVLNTSVVQIDLSKLINQPLPAGIYFVQVIDKKGSEVKRWIKE